MIEILRTLFRELPTEPLPPELEAAKDRMRQAFERTNEARSLNAGVRAELEEAIERRRSGRQART